MVFDNQIADKTAELLLQINAIKLSPKNPFKWSSGWLSPIYCDNRLILSFPSVRKFITTQMAFAVNNHFGRPDVIAGVATGAIGIGALVAEAMELPFVYVRPEAKTHGRENQIEGQLDPGQRVVVIEDLISTGGSSLRAVRALRNYGALVKGMVAIFSYGFPQAKEAIEAEELNVITLSNYERLLEQAALTNYIAREEQNWLQSWHKNPELWKG